MLFTPQIFAAMRTNPYVTVLSHIDPSNGRTETHPTGYDYPTLKDEILYEGDVFYGAQSAALDTVRTFELGGFRVSEFEQGLGSCSAPTLRIVQSCDGCLTRYFYAEPTQNN